MGQAREVMDRLTAAMNAKDKETLAGCYAANAVACTPDQGELSGRDAITGYLFHFWEALPDVRYELTESYEAGDVAIDEGYVVGTNTGPLQMPTGETVAATGAQLRIRTCDIAQVGAEGIVSHRFYFDQMEFLGQLGLLQGMPT